MNIEAIDFLNQLNEYGKIDYADYSSLHDLLTSNDSGWEYAVQDYRPPGYMLIGDVALPKADRESYYGSRPLMRRRKAGPWEKVEA